MSAVATLAPGTPVSVGSRGSRPIVGVVHRVVELRDGRGTYVEYRDARRGGLYLAPIGDVTPTVRGAR